MRMSRMAIAVVMIAALGLTACASAPYGGAAQLDTPVRTQSVLGFELRSPDVLVGPQGVSLHGALCRKLSWARSPRQLRLELIGPGGEVLSQRLQALRGVSKSHRQCVFYDIPTAWTLKPGQTLQMSAE